MNAAKLAACLSAGRDPKQSRPFFFGGYMEKTEHVKYLELARDVLDAIKNNQIAETDYELEYGEIGEYQVLLLYDKGSCTYKGFFLEEWIFRFPERR